MTDPRKNLPSASSFGIDFHCQGRQNLMRSLDLHTVADANVDELALRGTRIHAALESGKTDGLADDEIEDFKLCYNFQGALFTAWKGDALIQDVEVHKEERLWLLDDEFNPVMSGQPDYVAIHGRRAICLDYKTGYLKGLPASDRSWQLRTLAYLVQQNYAVEHVRVAYIRPKSKYEPTDVTDYDLEALQRSGEMIREVLRRSSNPNAPLEAGVWCRWCNAQISCPKALDFALSPTQGVSLPLKKADAAQVVANLSEERRFALQKVKSTIQNILDANQTYLKAQPAEYLAQHGYKIGQGRRLNEVDTKGAILALTAAGVPPERVPECFAYVKDKAVEVVMGSLKLSEGAAKKWLDDVLGPHTDKEKRAAGSLEEL